MPTDPAELQAVLDDCLEVEFTHYRTDHLAVALAQLPTADLRFVIDLVRRVASTHRELAYRCANQAIGALRDFDYPTFEAWVLLATDCYDREGLRPALAIIDDRAGFRDRQHAYRHGAHFSEHAPVLTAFLRGLSGRSLELQQAEVPWTDGEVIYLPAVEARLDSREANFRLLKATTVMLWAQTRFGTFHHDLLQLLEEDGEYWRSSIHRWWHWLETWRLRACIGRELPGVRREFLAIDRLTSEGLLPDSQMLAVLETPEAGVLDTLALARVWYDRPFPPDFAYQGFWYLPETLAVRQQRLLREKTLLRVHLRDWLQELEPDQQPDSIAMRLALREYCDPHHDFPRWEWSLDDRPVAPPERLGSLLSSIYLDWGAIPAEYLQPAGPGDYDPQREGEQPDAQTVWQGAYHETGACLYDEWDYQRRAYRKQWCVVRELEVPAGAAEFYPQTLIRYRGPLYALRRTFEILKGEQRRLRRQFHGEDVDLDALVDAWADVHAGQEMSDRLLTHLRRDERNIAVMLMLDMSGSTRGWVNDAERESLVLLTECLSILGDRLAIYGFSGITRKRCEIFRIKTFSQLMDDGVKERIAGISAMEYTRMGFAIRHLGTLLREQDAAIRLLITLSDGKPEDYDGYYRGQYGIEDTRQALFEVRRMGIHPFCITIDEQGQDYLPHLYGPAHYVVIKDIAQLPLRVAEIYRRLTS